MYVYVYVFFWRPGRWSTQAETRHRELPISMLGFKKDFCLNNFKMALEMPGGAASFNFLMLL